MSTMLRRFFRTAAPCLCLLIALAAVPSRAEESRTTEQMLKAAESGSNMERYTAIDDLGERHAHATQVVSPLIKMLHDSDPQVRWRAARTLGEYRGQAKAAAASLRKLLGDEDPVVRYHAAVALGKLDDRSGKTVEALVDAATSKDPRVARAAIGAIRSLKPGPKRVAKVLGKALKSDDQAVTLYALEVLVEEGAGAVPFLKEALNNPETAYLACAAIVQIGPSAAPVVPELTALLGKTKHSKLLIEALLALGSIGPAAASAEPQIAPLLGWSTDATVPVAAAYALGSIGTKGADAELQRAAKEGDPFLQMMAAWAIAKIHPDDIDATKAAIQKLTQAMKSDNVTVRSAAAKSLQSLNAPPELVAPSLIALVNDPDPAVRTNLIDAIVGLGPSIVPRVCRGLKNPQLQGIAIQALTKLGPKAAGAVESLIDSANDAEPKVRTQIQFALAAIGPAAAPATEMLVKSLSSKDAGERESALYALRKIGSGAKVAIKPLMEGMKDDDSFESNAAAWALARIAPDDPNVAAVVTPKLLEELSKGDEQARLETVEAMVDLGTTSQAVSSALERAAKEDSSSMVRSAAEAALRPKSGQ